jgi:fructose-bisphosphate aldolase class II
VLHGGSGISANDFRKAISLGISKVNVCTAILNETVSHVKTLKEISYPKLSSTLQETAYRVIKNHMIVFANAKH